MRPSGTSTLLALGLSVAAIAAISPAHADIMARPAYDFVDSFGVCGHWSRAKTVYNSGYEQLKAALDELGIRYTRHLPANDLGFKRLRDLNSSLGIRVSVTVDDIDNADFKTRKLDAGSVAARINLDAEQLGAAIVSFEGPNEYNSTAKTAANTNWPQDLRSYMAALNQAVQSNPAIMGLPVIAPSVAENTPAMFGQLGNLSSVSNRGNIHAYSGERPISAVLDDYIQLAGMVNPGQPVVITEYGWNTAMNRWQSHPLTDKAKAKYLTRSLAEIFSRPAIERAYIYQLADVEPDPDMSNPKFHFGLITNDLTNTMSYYGIRNTIQLLCDKDPGLSPRALSVKLAGDMQNVKQILLQKGSGVFDLVLWQELASYEQPKLRNALQAREWTPQAQTVTLDFGEPIAQVRTYLPTALDGDPDGGRKPKASYDQPTRITLDVPDELLVVEIIPQGVTPPDSPPTNCR